MIKYRTTKSWNNRKKKKKKNNEVKKTQNWDEIETEHKFEIKDKS